MKSVVRYLEKKLRLKVNLDKSAVAQPKDRHFVGFRVVPSPSKGTVEILLSKRSVERINAKIRELTPRNWGNSMRACIRGLNKYLIGWIGFFGICTDGVERDLGKLDAHIRRRLRAIQLKHWKRKKTIAKKLEAHGTCRKTAWKTAYEGKRSWWKLSHTPGVNVALPNKKFVAWGLTSLKEKGRAKRKAMAASEEQLMLPLG